MELRLNFLLVVLDSVIYPEDTNGLITSINVFLFAFFVFFLDVGIHKKEEVILLA